MHGFMVGGHGTGKVFQQGVGHFHCKLVQGFALGFDAELLAHGADFRLAFNRKIQRPFTCFLQRQHALAATGTVRCCTRCQRAQHVARHDKVGIGTAYAARGLLGYLAGAHEAVLAADARNAERALGLLGIKAVEHRVDAQFLHAKEHVAHCRVGRLLDNLLLVGERLLILAHRLRVVVEIGMIVMVVAVLMLVLALRNGACQFFFVYSIGISGWCCRGVFCVGHALSSSFLVLLLGF